MRLWWTVLCQCIQMSLCNKLLRTSHVKIDVGVVVVVVVLE